MPSTNKYDLIIIGAGFSGLYMLHKAREMGLTAKVFETGDNVGGTWYWNRYPGARCDIESIEYCFEFAKDIQQSWSWPERFSAQPDILAYINHVADHFDLRSDIQFNSRIESAIFNEVNNTWKVQTEDGAPYSSTFLIAASGCLSAPLKPKFEGLETFSGDIYHTGMWPHEGVDFSGKRVAVIGTGSSGVQCIPEIAKQAEHLTVYQRTPAFAVPARNRPLTADETETAKKLYDNIRMNSKNSQFAFGGQYLTAPTPMISHSADQRLSNLEKWWDIGGLLFLFSYPEILINAECNAVVADFVREKIAKRINDPTIAAQLMPKGVIGSKRLCSETGYYQTFNRPNVTLIDAKKTPVNRFTPNGIETSASEQKYDAVVLATGYDAMTGALSRIDIRGIDNCSLKVKWKEHPSTYLGIQVAGFPNLFMVAAGPGSPTALTNVVQSIEHHINWISDCIYYILAQGKQRIEATIEAEKAWVDHVTEVANMTLFVRGESWYQGANVPGKACGFMPYAAGFPAYSQKCAQVAANNYEGFELN